MLIATIFIFYFVIPMVFSVQVYVQVYGKAYAKLQLSEKNIIWHIFAYRPISTKIVIM